MPRRKRPPEPQYTEYAFMLALVYIVCLVVIYFLELGE